MVAKRASVVSRSAKGTSCLFQYSKGSSPSTPRYCAGVTTVTEYSWPNQLNVCPGCRPDAGGNADGALRKNDTAYSAWASESQPLVPSLKIMCHSFHPPRSYS